MTAPSTAPRPLQHTVRLAHQATHRAADVAIADHGRSVTYEELYAWAGGVASSLLERDPDGTAPVPVVVDRSVMAAAAILGVMLAGRGFAAVDVADPAGRTLQTFERLGATVAVDGSAGAVPLPELGVPVVDARAVRHQAIAPRPVEPDAFGMIVLTSGSTGVPKGVVYTNQVLDDYLAVREATITELGAWRAPVFVPFSYVAGALRVYADVPLGVEARVIDPSSVTPVQLADWVDEHQFEFMSMTPSLARSFAQRMERGRRLHSVRRVQTFGEGLSWSDVEVIRSVVSPEAAVTATFGASEGGSGLRFTAEPGMPLGSGPVPLGVPRDESGVRLEPVSDEPGSPTQLVLRGPVAWGYLGEPERTATVFGTDPDGVRFWRSGDLAVRTPDGLFHHAGRVDDLVKIRGRLVEPSEPERVLKQIDWIHHVVVLPHTLPSGAVRLVAHVEPVAGATTDVAALRQRLGAELPAHLVPSVFMQHERLPLNERGKVNRTVLREQPVVPYRTGPARPAADEVEQVVTGIVARVLGVGEIGPDDDLWSFGCDSLAAVEIVSDLADAGFEGADLDRLLDATTPAELAARVRRPVTRNRVPLTRFNAAGSRPPIWVVAGAGGSALAYRAVAAELGANQPLHVFEARNVHRRGRVDLSVQSAARHHLRVLRAEQPHGPYVLAGHSAGGVVAYEMAQQLHAAGEAVTVVALDAPAGAAARAAVEAAGPAPAPPPNPNFTPSLRNSIVTRLGMAATVCGWRSRHIVSRYGYFLQIHSRVARRYRPAPAAFPVVVVQVAGGRAAVTWRTVAPHLTVSEVGGDHNSMLQPPHAAAVAAVLVSAPDMRRACDAGTSTGHASDARGTVAGG